MEHAHVLAPEDSAPSAAPLQTICVCGNLITPFTVAGHVFTPRLCPECEAREEEIEQDLLRTQRLQQLGLRPRWLEVTFDNLCEPRPPEAAISACRLFAATCLERGADGLYLWSRTNGTGKTHLAAAIALTVGDGFFINASELLDAVRDSYAGDGYCKEFQAARHAPLLVLDDLGAQRITEWGEERLYVLLNRRYDDLLPLVVTSNLAPDRLGDAVGERIASRIMGMCAKVHVEGPDHRRLRGRTIC